jgi:putative ABC transport system permease protein
MLTQTWTLLRQLAKQRTFAITTIATLALGIGATTAIFSTVNATLLRPLPYAQAEDIYWLRGPYVDGRTSTGRLTGAYVAGVNEGAPSVVRAVALSDQESVFVSPDGDNRQVLINGVTEGFFELFGLPMAQGRSFTPEEHQSGAVVISHALWTTRYGRDPGAVGRTLELTNGTFPIVGVAPAEFDIPVGSDAWFSFSVSPTALAHNYESYLRARPGTDRGVLQDELDAVMAGLIQQYPAAATGRAFMVTPLVTSLIGDLGSILVIVLGGALVLLLVGAVNVATLMLARGAGRTKDVAVRTALGASRGRIAGRFLAEALLLSSAGTVLGLGLAWLGVRVLSAVGGATLPRLDTIPFDTRVLVFAGIMLIVTALLTGLLPAVVLTRTDIQGLLNESGRSNTQTRGSRRVLGGLVVAEVALAIALVAGAGLMVRSYQNVTRTRLGFEPQGRIVFTALLQGTRWSPPPVIITGPDGRPMLDPNQPPSESPATWLQQVSDRLLASGQVEAVGAGRTLPFGAEFDGTPYVAANRETYDPNRKEAARQRIVGHTFFEAMGTRLLAGRGFEPQESAPGVIVNETFARTLFPDQDALSKSFSVGFPEVNFGFSIPIIGVVEDVKYASPTLPAMPEFFVPGVSPRLLVVVKTTLDDPTPLIPMVQDEVAGVDPGVPVTVDALPDIVAAHVIRNRIGLVLMVLFAVMSLALAGIGIYGVLSKLTEERRTELATRAAFGAAPADVRDLIVRQGSTLAAIGAAIGLGLAYVGGRLAASRLFEVPPFDVPMMGLAVTAVLAVTVIAFLLPAFKAARRSPSDGLRAE